MLKISRLVYIPAIYSILNLESVNKIEIKKSRQGFNKPIARVHIYLSIDKNAFHTHLGDLKSMNNSKARTIAKQAQQDGFIKESAYEKMCCPMPKKFRKLCDKYSQEFFNKYGELERLT